MRHVATVILAAYVSVGALAESGRGNDGLPNDPLLARQVSFVAEPGPVALMQHWARPTVSNAVLAEGVGLDAPGAWAITTGASSVIVAVLDDGFFYQHEDIAANVWRNPGESGLDANSFPRENNGRDDDRDGFVDDVVGWDFVFNDPDPEVYAFDGMDRSRIQPYQHAMPALGIIGARGNNGIGIAGLNWQVSLMLLRIGAQGIPRGETDLARADRAARAIRFAADHGARVINWSGYVDTSDQKVLQPLRDAVAYAATREVLLVTGAGNDGRDLDANENCLFPQCFDLPNQVRVAEAEFDGQLVKYETGGQVRGSNYGRRRVEIAAIGQNFSTTVSQGRSGYGTAGGTSNAGPVVAGVAALILSLRPTMTAAELRVLLMQSAVRRPELHERIVSGGIVNARRAVELTNRRITPGQGSPRRPD